MTASEKKKAYYQANKEKWKKYRADARAKFPERDNEVAKRYYWRHRDKILGTRNGYLKTYVLKNKESLKLKRREHYLNNREAILAKNKIYRKANPVQRKAHAAKYREKHKDKLRLKRKEWRRRNPAKALNQVHRRRLPDERRHPSAAEFIAHVRSKEFIPCYWCGRKVPGKSAHIDHVIAISRGGNHCSSNLCASCASCNCRKHAMLPSEWIKSGQLKFDL